MLLLQQRGRLYEATFAAPPGAAWVSLRKRIGLDDYFLLVTIFSSRCTTLVQQTLSSPVLVSYMLITRREGLSVFKTKRSQFV